MDYYTFCRDPKHNAGGKADLYLKCLVEEIKPFVASRYRIRPEREQTGILGSSLGGLLSLYAAWRHNDVFGLAGVVSPSIWWADEAILKVIAHTPARKTRFWIDMGTNEGTATAFDGTTSRSSRRARCATGCAPTALMPAD
jgi:predicted alpha/beta superfamily hydrolase